MSDDGVYLYLEGNEVVDAALNIFYEAFYNDLKNKIALMTAANLDDEFTNDMVHDVTIGVIQHFFVNTIAPRIDESYTVEDVINHTTSFMGRWLGDKGIEGAISDIMEGYLICSLLAIDILKEKSYNEEVVNEANEAFSLAEQEERVSLENLGE